jgi:hypothetical protein
MGRLQTPAIAPNAMEPQLAPGEHVTGTPVQGPHTPPAQTPLLQSAATAQALPLSTRQRPNWHLLPAQSLSMSQAAPPGALQVGALHAPVAQSPFTAQSAHFAFTQRPLAQLRAFAQSPPVWILQIPPRQAPLAQSVSNTQEAPAAVLHIPAPSQASVAVLQLCGSFCPAGTLAHAPTEPGRLHDWHAPTQAISQQTPSVHWLVTQLALLAQGSPGQILQFPPQSTIVSRPFFTPSEQLTQVWSDGSHVGFRPWVQSALVLQLTQFPLSSQVPFAHTVPAATGKKTGTPAAQVWSVQAFPSSGGRSFASFTDVGFPLAPHTFLLQSFAVCVAAGNPVVSFGVQTDATHVETVHPSFVGGPQSVSITHATQVWSISQPPELVLVATGTLDVEPPPPAPPLPEHWSRSLQSSGANRHPSAHAASPAVARPAKITPSRAYRMPFPP